MVGRLRRWYKCLECRTRVVITVATTGEWFKVDTTADLSAQCVVQVVLIC